MADEERSEEREPHIFTLTEAERTRKQLEPILVEAIEHRRKMGELDSSLAALASRIMLMGGMQISSYESAAKTRFERDSLAESVRAAMEHIEETGCLVKDLDSGLLDFPAMINNEAVYLCWKLGEDRIRFYHRQDEGFAGRKPIDPGDTGPRETLQ